MWELGENSDCGTTTTVCKEFVLSCKEGVLLRSIARRLEAAMDCFIVPCSPEEKSFKTTRSVGVYEVEVRDWSAENRSHTVRQTMRWRKGRVESLSYLL